jgi:hypothetical protein
MMASRKRK